MQASRFMVMTLVLGFGAGAMAGEPAVTPAAMKSYVQGELRPGEVAVEVLRVWPLREFMTAYQVSDSDHGQLRAAMRLRPGAEGAAWRFERLGQRVEMIEAHDDGSLHMGVIDNIEKGVTVKFSPALCVMPARLEPGKPHVTHAKMRVVDRKNPANEKASGDAKMTVVYEGDQMIHVPAGTFDCRRIRVMCEADFGWGHTRNISTYYFAEGVGLVAEHYQSSTSILLIPSSREIRAVMADSPTAAADTAEASELTP